MRKTMEELVNECVSELKDSQFDFNDLDAADKQMLFQWFETFRRLCIENERECTEPVAEVRYKQDGYTFVAFNGSDVPVGVKLFTFPPAAPDPRDEALRIARVALDELSKLGNGKLVGNSVGNVLASEALAAIDKVWSYGEAKEVK